MPSGDHGDTALRAMGIGERGRCTAQQHLQSIVLEKCFGPGTQVVLDEVGEERILDGRDSKGQLPPSRAFPIAQHLRQAASAGTSSWSRLRGWGDGSSGKQQKGRVSTSGMQRTEGFGALLVGSRKLSPDLAPGIEPATLDVEP